MGIFPLSSSLKWVLWLKIFLDRSIYTALVTLRKPIRVWRSNWNVKMGETRTGWHRKANKKQGLKLLAVPYGLVESSMILPQTSMSPGTSSAFCVAHVK